MELYKTTDRASGLTQEEVHECLRRAVEGRDLHKVLLLPPDFTRFHSGAGPITNYYYHLLTERGVHVDILPALGTHEAMSPAQLQKMFGDIPQEAFLVHDWRRDVVKLGEVPADFVEDITGGLWHEPVDV